MIMLVCVCASTKTQEDRISIYKEIHCFFLFLIASSWLSWSNRKERDKWIEYRTIDIFKCRIWHTVGNSSWIATCLSIYALHWFHRLLFSFVGGIGLINHHKMFIFQSPNIIIDVCLCVMSFWLYMHQTLAPSKKEKTFAHQADRGRERKDDYLAAPINSMFHAFSIFKIFKSAFFFHILNACHCHPLWLLSLFYQFNYHQFWNCIPIKWNG